MPEVDPLVFSFSHLADFPRSADALHTLKKIASLVKPLMRARGWKVTQLVEFYPNQQNLLGLNVNHGQKICLRLRYPGDKTQFLPLEQVADTMLHELAHIVHGPHDAKFNALWNQLRDEHMSLTLKGFTGEGFMSEGHRLGGRTLPMDEARRLARASAERRRTLGAGSGRRLGGAAPRPGQDIRKVIADSVEQRNRTLRGCANDNQTQDQIIEIADTATRNGFRTKAEEDAANEAAIAQALWELVQEEEKAKKGSAYRPPTADIGTNQDYVGFYGSGQGPNANVQPSTSRPAAQRQEATGTWACSVCTLSNPLNYLCCDACGTERGERTAPKRQAVIDLTGPDDRHVKKSTSTSSSSSASKGKEPRKAPPRPQPKISSTSSTWACHFCGRVRESQWWSCDLCGAIKTSS